MKDLGKVITVNGPIEPDDVGVTLMHEHLLFTCLMWFLEGDHRGLGSDSYVQVTGENAAWLREFPYRSRENLINTDWQLSAREIRRFKMALGQTVVDSSSLVWVAMCGDSRRSQMTLASTSSRVPATTSTMPIPGMWTRSQLRNLPRG